MPERHELERLFVGNLEQISRISRFMCRRHGMSAEEAEECESWVRLRLVENDYASLRKFRGESALLTYLTVVIAMLVRDYRVQQWGRWRPSAAALRMGPAAVHIESLVYRDGLSLNEALHVMRGNGFAALSERELTTIFATLKPRLPMRPREVGEESLASSAAGEQADAALLVAEQQAERARLESAVTQELKAFNSEDRTILRLTLCEGLSIADVARGLGLQQRALYRHLERLKRELRSRLERAGITRERAAAVLEEESA